MLALTTLALVPRILLGYLLIEIVWRAETRSRLLELFMAPPLGFGISSLLAFLWIWVGLPLRLYAVIETALVSVIFLVWLWKRIDGLWPSRGILWRSGGSIGVGWWLCLGAAAFIFAAQFWTISLQNPHGDWDAWVHWNVVSRFVYRGGEQWRGTFLRVYDQPDYPLLLAITNATTWELVQKETTRGPMVFAFISTVSLVGMFIGLIRGLRGSQQACLAGVVILSLPSLAQIGASQYADVPEACYFLASAGIMLLYFRWRTPRLPLLAGLMVGLGAWAKNEGVVFAASNFLVWSYLSWRDRNPAIRDFILGAAPALVVLGLFKVFLAPRSDAFGYPAAMMASFLDPARYLDVLRQIGSGFWRDPGAFPVLAMVVVAYAAVMARSPQGVQGLKPLAFAILAQAGAYLLIYVGTPYAYGTASMIPTSIGRLSMHLIPLAFAGLFLWLRSPAEIDLRGGRADC